VTILCERNKHERNCVTNTHVDAPAPAKLRTQMPRKYFAREDGELGVFGVDTDDDNHSSSQSAIRESEEEPDEEPARPGEEGTAVSAPHDLPYYDENGYSVGSWSFPGPPYDPYEDYPENYPF
jgi:hypothetical protein